MNFSLSPEALTSFFSLSLGGNSLLAYAQSLGICVLLIIVFLTIRKIAKSHQQSKKKLNPLRSIFAHVHSFFLVSTALYVSVQFLTLPLIVSQGIFVLFGLAATKQLSLYLSLLLTFTTKISPKEQGNKEIYSMLKGGMNIMLWSLALLLLLSNVGVNINSLIAGLGIGGIAIALAVQNILGDVFSFVAIHFDKPFVEGDLIKIGGTIGVIKKIGIRTTRLKSLSGEEIIVSNKEVISAQITNYKRSSTRKVTFQFDIHSDTPNDVVASIPMMVEDIIKKIQDITFVRCHFIAMKEAALTFECIYEISHTEYEKYLDANQELLLALREACEKKKINLIPPTNHVFIDAHK